MTREELRKKRKEIAESNGYQGYVPKTKLEGTRETVRNPEPVQESKSTWDRIQNRISTVQNSTVGRFLGKELEIGRNLGKRITNPTQYAIEDLNKTAQKGIRTIKEGKSDLVKGWVDKGAFSNGYQFGDVTRSAVGTTADITKQAFKGAIAQPGEALGDLMSIAQAGYNEYIKGDKKRAEAILRKASEDHSDDIASGALGALGTAYKYLGKGQKAQLLLELGQAVAKGGNVGQNLKDSVMNTFRQKYGYYKNVGEDSLLGEAGEDTVSSMAKNARQRFLQDQLAIPWQTQMFAETMPETYLQKRIKEGLTPGQSIASSLADFSIEWFTEEMFDGIKLKGTGNTTINKFLDANINKLQDNFERTTLKYLKGVYGEATEEVVGAYMSALSDYLIKHYENKDWTMEDIAQAIKDVTMDPNTWKGAISAGLSVGGQTVYTLGGDVKGIYRNEQRNQAIIDSSLSQEDKQTLIDSMEYEAPEKPNKKEIQKQEEMKSEVDEILNKLDGEERKRVQSALEQRNISSTIQESELDENQKNVLSNIAQKYQLTLDEIQTAIEKTKNGEYGLDELTRTQNNEVLNGEQQITQTEGKTSQNETSNDIGLNLRKSIDAYNNSRQEGDKIFDINDENTKKEIDAIQKVAEKRGLNVTFDESRFNNNNINAFYEYDDNGNVARIVLNPNTSTKKYVQNLVVHEMTHSFEGSKEYEKLSKAVLDYAKSKGEYNKAFQDLKNTYAGVYSGEKLNQVVEKEAVANILGEKLGSKEFIDDLVNGTYSQENRNFVQKIYDFVKEQINRFKGYKDQEAYWNNVKKLFDDAYNNSEISKGEAYSTENTINSKQQQLEIIQKSNPKDETLGDHTWIENVDDIKTFQEALNDDGYNGEKLTPDFTADDVNKALDSGTITVYSSYPIEDGIFVTPSKMEAQNYAGNGQVYSKEVNLNDVAWIDSLQGQYAKVEQTQTSTTDSQGRTLSKQQQEYFKDSKARDENGKLIPMYHSTSADFTIFDKGKLGENTAYDNTDFGFFVTSNRTFSERFKDIDNEGKQGKTMEVYIDTKKPITHPYNASYKYSGEELDRITREWLEATDEAEGIKQLEEVVAEGEADSIWQAYMDLTFGDNPYEIASEERKILESKGYDAVEFVEGDERTVIEGSKSVEPVTSYAVFNSNQIKNTDNTNPTTNPDIRYSVETEDLKTDNQGNKINKGMQEYLKGISSEELVKGKVPLVFHTTTGYGSQFTEFNPVGTEGYKFGEQPVNYFTDSQDMSSSYADGTKIEKANTKKLNTLEEAKEFVKGKYEITKTEDGKYRVDNIKLRDVFDKVDDWFNTLTDKEKDVFKRTVNKTRTDVYENIINADEIPTYSKVYQQYINLITGTGNQNIIGILPTSIPDLIDQYINGKEVKTGVMEYNTEKELLRNLPNLVSGYAKRQYQGYVKLTNPYVVEGNGNLWKFVSKVDENTIKKQDDVYNSLSDEEKKNLITVAMNTESGMYGFENTTDGRSNIFMNALENTWVNGKELAKKLKPIWTTQDKAHIYDFIKYGFDESQISRNYSYSTNEIVYKVLDMNKEGNNYDGVIIKDILDYGSNYAEDYNKPSNVYVTFNSNQFKAQDNENPTNDPDIRYSQDVTGAWNNFMEKYFKNEGTGTAIKDMKKLPVKTYSMQDIDNVLNETTLSDELKQEFRNDLKGKTITKEIFNEYKDAIKQVEKDYENYNAERKPSWDDIGEVFEQPSEEVESPLQDRDIETIGKETKKNAYQYENPEVKPYFQEMAQMIGEDLAYASDPMNRRTKKGGGTVLQANTKAINDLHNKYGYSYEQIGIGLNNIIEDNGAENNAVSKKIEFYIDDALRNGYRNIQGQYIQPNQDYINTIQYSMETENQAEKIEEEKPKPKVLNPTQISNLTLEDVSTTPKLPNKKYKEGSKVSSFVSNIENDVGFLNEEEKQELLKDDNVKYYAEITNADTLAKAYDNLKENGKDATLKWYTKPTANATAEDVATGWILLKQYSDKGDTEGMVNVAKKLRDMGTKAGQTVQAFNILSRLTPEGMVAYTQGELQDAYNEMIKGKSKKWIDQHKSDFDLSQDEIAFIMDTMQNLPAEDPSNNNYDRKVALGQIQKLFTDKIPSENNKIKAWMRISMLFNPKTQVRNVTGNAGVVPVNMTSDFLGSKVDKILSKYTGVRTLGNPNAKAYLKGMKEGFYQSYNDFKLGINTRDIEQNKFEFGQGKAFKDKGIGKALNRVDNMLNFIMDFGDRGFSQASFVNSLNNQMLLNGVTTPTQDMIDIATQEALSRTWNDNNEYTKFVLGVRRALNKVGTKNYGLGDVLIPFAKTPANLTKAIVEYSPVGLTKQILNIKDIKNAIETGQFTSQQQHEFADKMGKGLAGTLLYIAGYALAQAGIATGEPDEDKDVKNFMKNSLGIAPYSIKIGDKSFTYDWSQPVATPLAIMTNLYQTNKNNPDATMLDKIMSATNIGTNQLMEQSFMESLNEVLNGNGEITDRIQKAILDLPARAIPTFSKQIADMVDGTQRTSFEYGQPVKSAINSAKAKLPFVSKELTPVVDTLGNEVEKYGGENNWFNVFFNPANMNKGKKTRAGEEIYNVYQETGDTTIFPVTAPYYVNQDGAKITMDSKQRAEYQKTAGDYTEETVNKLINDSDYQKLDDPEKAEILSQVVKDSNEKAKRDVLNINNKSSDLELIDKVGADYYTYKIATKGMKTDAEQCEALERKNYSNQNKQLIYESEINKDDKTFEGLKKINKNFNMDEYLKYKTQKFSGDTKKEDTINYVNGLNLNGIERLYIIGRTYKLKEDRELFESLLKNKMPLQDVDSILQTLK